MADQVVNTPIPGLDSPNTESTPIPGLDAAPISNTGMASSNPSVLTPSVNAATPIPGLDSPNLPLDSTQKSADTTNIPPVVTQPSQISIPTTEATNPVTTGINTPETGTVNSVPASPTSTETPEQINTRLDEEKKNHHFWQHPFSASKVLTNGEINAKASKWGVSPSLVREWMPALDASLEGMTKEEEDTMWHLGAAGEALGGLPNKELLRELRKSDPNKYTDKEGNIVSPLVSALDELRELSGERKSYLHSLAEIAPMVVAGGVTWGLGKLGLGLATEGATSAIAPTLLKRVATSAAENAPVGTAFGVGGSAQNKEVQGAVGGTIAAGTIGAAVPVLGAAYRGVLNRVGIKSVEEGGIREVSQGIDNLGNPLDPKQAYISPHGENKWEPAVPVNPDTHPEIVNHSQFSEEKPNFYQHSEGSHIPTPKGEPVNPVDYPNRQAPPAPPGSPVEISPEVAGYYRDQTNSISHQGFEPDGPNRVLHQSDVDYRYGSQLLPKPKPGDAVSSATHSQKVTGKEIQEETAKILESQKESNTNTSRSIQDFTHPDELDSKEASNLAREQLDPEVLTKYKDPNSEEGKFLINSYNDSQESGGVIKLDPEFVEIQLGKKIYENQLIDFARDLDSRAIIKTADDALATIKQFSKKSGGSEAVAGRFEEFTHTRVAGEYIADNGVHFKTDEWNLAAVGRSLSEAQLATRQMEDRFGVGQVVNHSEWNQGIKLHQATMSTFRKDLDHSISKFGRKSLNDAQVVLDTVSNLPPKSELGKELLGIVNEANEWAGPKGASLKHKEDGITWINPVHSGEKLTSIPAVKLSPNKIPGAFDKQLDKALAQAGLSGRLPETLSKQEVNQLLSTEAGSELARGFQLEREGTPLESGMQLKTAFESLVDPPTSKFLLSTIKSVEQKDIPMFLRETNPLLAADNYIQKLSSDLYLRPGMRKMLAGADLIQKAGGEAEANYVRRLVGDNMGIRRSWSIPALGTALGLRYSRMLDSADAASTNPVVHAAVETGRAIPLIWNEMIRNVHTNVISLKAPVVLVHLATIPGRGLPMLGNGPLATELILRGASRIAMDQRNYWVKSHVLGLSGNLTSTRMAEFLSSGLRSSGLYRYPESVLNAVSNTLAVPLHVAYTETKALGLGMGDSFAGMLAKGDLRYIGALERLPTSVKLQVQHIGYQNTKQTGIVLGRFFGDHMAQNYTKASMSEFGRSIGPVLNMFQKWPSVAVGDLVKILRTRSTNSNQQRLMDHFLAKNKALLNDWLAPGLLIGGSSLAMFGPRDKWTDRQKAFLGTEGISGGVSMNLGVDMVKGAMPSKPWDHSYQGRPALSHAAYDAIYKSSIEPLVTAGKDYIQGDKDKEDIKDKMKADFSKGFARDIQMFSPGGIGALTTFFTDTLPLMITGEKTKGTDFIEKAKVGIKRYHTEIPAKLKSIGN